MTQEERPRGGDRQASDHEAEVRPAVRRLSDHARTCDLAEVGTAPYVRTEPAEAHGEHQQADGHHRDDAGGGRGSEALHADITPRRVMV
ncbi:hypothetical protein [Nocardioides sp. B-3]|uniref:hypothetical protein n=1 Tax=Nocardioides sp. B-3 TaxID=2895565 RepID=UPI0021531518|nr:hypothetical protein [Nocardioides sp. B-3]UUZ58656.1 hypothetical protein LP418_21430 [Nocardioides sp. B-3]